MLSVLVIFLIIFIIYSDVSNIWASTEPVPKLEKTKLWSKIPLIQCINLKERPDRFKDVKEEFQKVGMEHVKFYRPNRHKRGGIVGCATSHLECMKKARDMDVPYTLIFEDDVKFLDDNVWFGRMNDTLKYIDQEYEKHQSHDWDLIRIGFIPLGGSKNIDRTVVKGESLTNTGYLVSRQGLKKLIPKCENYYLRARNIPNDKMMNIDEFYAFSKLNDLRLDRAICVQRQSKSDNTWPLNVNKICESPLYEKCQKHPRVMLVLGQLIKTFYYDLKGFRMFYDYDVEKMVKLM